MALHESFVPTGSPLLDLIRVGHVSEPRYVLAGECVFITSVEFWTAYTGVRLLWPLRPMATIDELWPTGVTVGGWSTRCGQWTVGGIRTHSDMYVTTDRPVDAGVSELTVNFAVGDLHVYLDDHRWIPEQARA